MPQIAHMYPFCYVFAQTNFNGAFHAYVPKECIFQGYNEAVLYKIMEEQVRKIKINLRLFERFSEFEDDEALLNIPNPYTFVLFDDTVAERQVHDSGVLNEIAYYGRHFRLGSWINTQHGHALNPGFRANADVAVTFMQHQRNQRETVRDEFMNFFDKKWQFEEFLDEHTVDNQFLAVHLGDNKKRVRERLYKGLSDPDVQPVKLGCFEYWRMYEKPDKPDAGMLNHKPTSVI